MGRKLTETEAETLNREACPNCESRNVYQGPGGGVSADVICCTCGARYRHTPEGMVAIDEPDEYVEEKEEKEAGITKERAQELEQAKLDRDVVFHKFQIAVHAKEKAEGELDLARMKIHDLVSASWSDSVQSEAAWRERALVGEKALESWTGANVALRTCVHRLLDEMVLRDERSDRRKTQEAVIVEAQELLESSTVGVLETAVVQTSLGLVAGTPGACDAWFAAVRTLADKRVVE